MDFIDNFKDKRNALMGAFLTVTGLSLSGCATPNLGPCMRPTGVNLVVVSVTSTKYDGTCAAHEAAKKMMDIPDAGARASGIKLFEMTSPEARQAGDSTRNALANQGEQTYTVRRSANGDAVLTGTPVITVETRQRATPAPASPPAAPAPAPAPQM